MFKHLLQLLCLWLCVDVLTNLSAIYIQRRFGRDFVDISNVTMETVAVARGNDLEEVSHVENCTCNDRINVAGSWAVINGQKFTKIY